MRWFWLSISVGIIVASASAPAFASPASWWRELDNNDKERVVDGMAMGFGINECTLLAKNKAGMDYARSIFINAIGFKAGEESEYIIKNRGKIIGLINGFYSAPNNESVNICPAVSSILLRMHGNRKDAEALEKSALWHQ